MRTAAALGYDALAVGSGGADPWSRRCVRVSMGAGFTFPLVSVDDGDDAAMRLRDHGFCIYGTVLARGAQPLSTFGKTGKHALVFGNEAAGLDDYWRSRCDLELTIPIARNDSLNVGVAAGIFMYHLSRMSGE
jgi:tRNA G18 (ribose-2'-O)-methylase SpoU